MSFKHEIADNNIICPYLYKKNTIIYPGQLYNDWVKSGKTKSRDDIIKKQNEVSFIDDEKKAARYYLDLTTRVKKVKSVNVINDKTLKTPLTEKEVFALLETIAIYDKSERKMDSNCISIINHEKLLPLMLAMDIMSKQLLTVIKGHTGVLSSLRDIDVKNFLYHIIAKGKIFYQGTLSDPNFCLYLIDDTTLGFQPLYEWISNACNKYLTKIKKTSILQKE